VPFAHPKPQNRALRPSSTTILVQFGFQSRPGAGSGTRLKLTSNTPQRLIVEDKPWFIAICISLLTLVMSHMSAKLLIEGSSLGYFYAAGAIFCLVFFYIFVRRVQVIFDAEHRYIEVRQRTLFRMSCKRIELADVFEATIEDMSSSEGEQAFRISLVMAKGSKTATQPLTKTYDNAMKGENLRNSINKWLSASRD
jgi:hypothetical protein